MQRSLQSIERSSHHQPALRGILRGLVEPATGGGRSPRPGRGAQGFALFVSLAACFGAGAIGGLLTADAVETWYQTLVKPTWTPPSWLFGPVWSALYLMMAVSAWLVWRRLPGRLNRVPLTFFAVQLVLNVLWSGLFFGLRLPGAAAIEIVALWLAVVATAIVFWRVSAVAGWLFVPYILWVSFATALNFAIWWLNA